MMVDEIGVDKMAVDETGVDEPGLICPTFLLFLIPHKKCVGVGPKAKLKKRECTHYSIRLLAAAKQPTPDPPPVILATTFTWLAL